MIELTSFTAFVVVVGWSLLTMALSKTAYLRGQIQAQREHMDYLNESNSLWREFFGDISVKLAEKK